MTPSPECMYNPHGLRLGIMYNTIRVMSINARGINKSSKRITLFKWLEDYKSDITLLQETFLTSKLIDTVKKEWDGTIINNLSNSTHSRGIAILFKKDLDIDIKNTISDKEGRRLLVNVTIQNQDYTIVTMYSPNICSKRIDFFKNTENWIHRYATNNSHLIVGGDMNSIMKRTDRSSGIIENCNTHFINFQNNCNLKDTWTSKFPEEVKYTYIPHNKNAARSRIDYILLSNHLLMSLSKINVITAPVPDHKAVVADLKIHPQKRGKGYWKLNCSYLYLQNIKDMFIDTTNEYQNCPNHFVWDLFKIRVKEFSIKYGIHAAKMKNKTIMEIQNNIDDFDQRIVKNPNDNELRDQRNILKKQYDTLSLEKAKGAQIRARLQWAENGEKNTSFFLNLENSRQTNNTISNLRDKNGLTVNDDKAILDISEHFYDKLYTSKKPNSDNITEYLNKLNVPKLDNDDQQICEGTITLQECDQVIKELKLNKSPGLDGLPCEFYKATWPYIGEYLVNVYRECFNNNQLSPSQKQSVITLLFKKGDKDEIKNYRPISLSNIDYKIIAFALANGLKMSYVKL